MILYEKLPTGDSQSPGRWDFYVYQKNHRLKKIERYCLKVDPRTNDQDIEFYIGTLNLWSI